MTEDAAVLARRFALRLEQLRGAWDLQYIGSGPVPERSAEVAGEPAIAEAGAVEPAPDHVEAEAEAETEAEAKAAATEAAATEAAATEPSSAPSPMPTPSPVSAPAVPSSAAAAAAPVSAAQVSAARSAPTGAEPTTDPDKRTQAAAARKEALREQAQRWSPTMKLQYLERQNVGDCRRCPLARTRTHIVFGVGDAQADVMFVGEAPGADEDRLGEPFVGRSGQLLDRWIEALGMARGDVYIANVIKCRPPGNRDPKPEEIDRCSPFLQAQIRAIEPKVIVALGRHAGMLLSRREDMTLRAMRSTSRLRYDAGVRKDDANTRIQIPLVVTYHPAYVLRQEGGGRQLPPGRTSPTEMVMTDLRRALSIAQQDDANEH